MWLAMIMLLAALVAALLSWGGGAVDFIEHYFRYQDTSYRPVDTERFKNNQVR